MTAKKKSGYMNKAVRKAPSGAVSKRVDGITQASKIPNTTGRGPSSTGVKKIPGTVSCPGDY